MGPMVMFFILFEILYVGNINVTIMVLSFWPFETITKLNGNYISFGNYWNISNYGMDCYKITDIHGAHRCMKWSFHLVIW